METFKGFPEAGLRFLDELTLNNNRPWFEARKQDYINYIQTPARAFVAALGEKLSKLSAGVHYDTRLDGSGSLMRIYRDVRFSKDKSPYKTNVGILFWEGERKKTENPGFYFHIENGEATMYDGLYTFPKPVLPAFREAVMDERFGDELVKAIETVKKSGYQVGGESLKRVPSGFDPAHPRADLLRHTTLYAESPKIAPKILASPQLVDVCFEHCRNMLPLHRWLVALNERAGSE